MVVAEALGETFRTREKETMWKRWVGELEAMLGVVGSGGAGTGGVKEGAGAAVAGVVKGATIADRDREIGELREKLSLVERERNEALRCLAEVRKVMVMSGGAAAG